MTLLQKFLGYVALVVTSLLMVFPIFYAFLISFMQGGEVLQGSFWPERFSLDNYKAAFERVPLLTYLINSVIVSFVIMLGQVVLSSLAAFAFVFIHFKGRDWIFYLFISTMMIPWEATMVPNFQTIQSLGWLNSYAGLTVPFFAMAFGTFLLRQHFKTIPRELYEASQIAGISKIRFFITVIIPVAKTSLITLCIYCFLSAWNMYLWPLLVTNNEENRTVQIGLKQMQTQEIASDWGIVMAGVMMVILPTLLMLFLGQKRLQEGLTQGALK